MLMDLILLTLAAIFFLASTGLVTAYGRLAGEKL
jgi:hypothetical protein